MPFVLQPFDWYGSSSIRRISATTALADGDVAEDKSLGRKWEFVHQVVLARSLENRIGLLLS